MGLRLTQDYFLVVFLLLVVLASAGDLLADVNAGASNSHLLQEGALLLLALSILGWILWEFRQKRLQLKALHKTLDAIRTMPMPVSSEVAEARLSLSRAIAEQFTQWELTESEREIGLMLLKGYSQKEIALLRGTTEKTIRQQASTIYQKSSLPGRHALSAWFIEDLL